MRDLFPKKIAVTCTVKDMRAKAEQLAAQLGLSFVDELKFSNDYDYFLVLTPDYLAIQNKSNKKPFYIDFLAGKLRYRSAKATKQNEALVKAIGTKNHLSLIVDATAGLGRDSFILATLGFRIIMLERSAILYSLLSDALKRASQALQMTSIIERLTLLHTDAQAWLIPPFNHPQPEVIYIDPMFPERKKSASVKKEMAILQDLLGKDEDAENLFDLAFACATQRVVVKRPRLAEAISSKHKPTYSVVGASSRFDIYLVPKR